MEVYVFILYMFAIFGGFGNLIAFCFYLRKKSTIPHIFIRTLALTDLFTCVAIIPFTIWMEYVDFSTSSDFVCQLYRFLTTSNIPFAAILMAPIAVDRYFSICKPFSVGINKRRAYGIIVTVILISMAFGVIFAVDSEIQHLVETFVWPSEMMDQINVTTTNMTTTEMTHLPNTSVAIKMVCINGLKFISKDFITGFRYFYASIYAISVLGTLSIYVVIYGKVVLWRKKRTTLFMIYSNKSSSSIVSMNSMISDKSKCHSKRIANTKRQQSSISILSSQSTSTFTMEQNKSAENATSGKKIACHKNVMEAGRSRMQTESFRSNVRLALMLFSVSVVFILAYLPAWLMIFDIIDFNVTVFYLYFSYNVIHPLTYVVMDKNFRREAWLKIHCREEIAANRNETERSRYS